MDISSFSKERILITINQSYNFDLEIVSAAKDIAIQKAYMSTSEVESILARNEEIRIEKKAKVQYSDSLIKKKKTLLGSVLSRLAFLKSGKYYEDDALRAYDISHKRRINRKY